MKTLRWLTLTFKGIPLFARLARLVPSGKLFKHEDKFWRWRGVTAFGLLARFEKGENIDDFLKAYEGFNLLRVFYYWESIKAELPPDDVLHRFLEYVEGWGFHVELVLFTGPPRPDAQQIVNHTFAEFAGHKNLVIELVNEPGVHEKVDPATLTVPPTEIPWTDGLTTAAHRGLYLTPHTPRDGEWERKAHDLKEYYDGGGPGSPSDPAIKQPAVGDEPAKKEDVVPDVRAWRAYFGVCSLLGAGGTFHSERGKLGLPPDDADKPFVEATLEGLTAFPEDAPLGPYSRPEDSSLRTYVVGHYMVRVRPTSLEGVVPGAMLDKDGILWRL